MSQNRCAAAAAAAAYRTGANYLPREEALKYSSFLAYCIKDDRFEKRCGFFKKNRLYQGPHEKCKHSNFENVSV
jgi:hypothetical protein